MLNAPYRLVALTLASCLLAILGFLAGGSKTMAHSVPALAVCFGCVLVGLAGLYWLPFKLRTGIRNDRWPPRTFARLQRIVTQPAWTAVLALLVIAMVVEPFLERHHHIWFWALFCLLTAQSQLGNALAPARKQPVAKPFLDWSRIPRLQSRHWGER